VGQRLRRVVVREASTETAPAPRKVSRLRRLVTPVASFLVLLGLAPLTQAGAAPSEAPIRVVGSLPRFGDEAVAAFGDKILPTGPFDPRGAYNGTLLAIPEARQLWQLYHLGMPSDVGLKTGVLVRDLDTLRPVKSFVLDAAIVRGAGGNSFGGEWLHAVDGDRRVFFATDFARPNIIEVDLKTFASKAYGFQAVPQPPSPVPPTLRLAGITYDRRADSVLGLFGLAAVQLGNQNYLARLDLKTGSLVSRQVRSCANAPLPANDQLAKRYATEVLLADDYVYVPCHRSGMAGIVVRLPRSSAFDVTGREDIAAGPPYLDVAFADHASGRMFLSTSRGEVWVFDARTMS
jgi:hypothetical protein